MSTESEQLRKIFVGGLNWETSEERLHDYFSKWGNIVDCVIMRKDGRSRGFGFVTFDKAKCVDDILKSESKFELDDREIEPKRSVPRDEANNPTALTKTKKIFVGGLPSTTTESDIHEYFGGLCDKFGSGKVIDIDLKKDRNNAARLRGFAFVTFDDEDVVEKVCAMRYHEIRMKSCEVKKAESQAVIRKRQEKDDMARGITRDRGDRDRDHGGMNMGNMPGMDTDVLNASILFQLLHTHPTINNDYSQTSPYGHLYNTDTSILWTVLLVLAKSPYIFYLKNLYNTDPL